MIRFENVSKTYKNGTSALKDITLDIDQGEFVFLVGARDRQDHIFALLLREELPDRDGFSSGRDIGIYLSGAYRICAATLAASSRTSGCCQQVGLRERGLRP